MDFSKKLNFKANSLILTIIVLLIVILINFLSVKHFFRVDVTENKQYTISNVTKEMLRNMDDIVNIKVFFSKKLPPQFLNLAQDVRDLLDEYEAHSRGNIKITYIDPAEDENVQNEIRMLGIPQIEMNVFKQDSMEVQKGYLGMGVFYPGKEKIIPVVQSTGNLEYDLTSAIKKVTAKDVKKIGFLSGHGEHGIDANAGYSALSRALSENYEIKTVIINEEQAIADVDTLIVAAPQQALTEREKYRIDQFIMNGGNAVFLIENIRVSGALQADEVNHNLQDLLEHYGIKIKKSVIWDQSNETANFSKGMFTVIQPYPFWPKLINHFFNKENPIVTDIEAISLLWASPLEIVGKTITEEKDTEEKISYEILATTTDRSGEIQGQNGQYNLDPSQEIKTNSVVGRQPMIVLAKGQFTSMFADTPVPPLSKDIPAEKTGSEMTEPEAMEITPATKEELAPETKKESEGEGKILVVGDADFLHDGFGRRFQHNFLFMLNAVDYLTLDEDLIYIRSKIVTDRPLEETSASQKMFIKGLGIFLFPVLVVIFAILKAYIRRKRKLLYAP